MTELLLQRLPEQEKKAVISSQGFIQSSMTQRYQLVKDLVQDRITLKYVLDLQGPYQRQEAAEIKEQRRQENLTLFAESSTGVYECPNPNCRSRNTQYQSMTITGDEATVIKAACLSCGTRWQPWFAAQAPKSEVDDEIAAILAE